MSKDIAKLLASKFIARSDVKARQKSNGEYNPTVDRDSRGNVTKLYGFDMGSLLEHLGEVATYGHYLLNTDNQCKLFAFDIDLDEPDTDKEGNVTKPRWLPHNRDSDGVYGLFANANPREEWKNRANQVGRSYMKTQLRTVAHMLMREIHGQFGIPTAMAYSGAKGVHVYGFTGLGPAKEVREGADIILRSTGLFESYLGNNFWKHVVIQNDHGNVDHEASLDCLTIEVFPKQTTIQSGGFGNLMRLPLGRNLKNLKDPCFFLDARTDFGENALTPRDAYEALTVADQWA